MTRSDALNKYDSKRQAVLITGVRSWEEQGEQSFGCGANLTEKYARGTGSLQSQGKTNFTYVFFLSLVVNSTLYFPYGKYGC